MTCLVDIHVYLVPSEQWRDHTRSVIAKIIDESVSVGFVRVAPELNLYQLREEIHNQLGDDIRHDYSFLRGVGRHLARIRPKQEFQLKVKSFLPPQTYSPEIFIVELSNGISTSLPSSEISSSKSEQLYSYMLQFGPHRNERNEFQNNKSVIPPIGSQPDERNSRNSPNISAINGRPYEADHSNHVSPSKLAQGTPTGPHPSARVTSPKQSPHWNTSGQYGENRVPSPQSRQATPNPGHDGLVHPSVRAHSPVPRLQYADPETPHHPSRVKTPRPSRELRLDAACQTHNSDYVHGDSDVLNTQRSLHDAQYHQADNVMARGDYRSRSRGEYPTNNRGVYPSNHDGRGDYALDGGPDYRHHARGENPSDGRSDYPGINQGGGGGGGYPANDCVTADGYRLPKSNVQNDVGYEPTRDTDTIKPSSERALIEKRRAQELYRQEMQALEAEERHQMALQQQGALRAAHNTPAPRPDVTTDEEKWPGTGMTDEWPSKTRGDVENDVRERDEPQKVMMVANDLEERTQPAEEGNPAIRPEKLSSDVDAQQAHVGKKDTTADVHAADSEDKEKKDLLSELKQVKGDRIVLERQREELVKKAKDLQTRTIETREQSKYIWKQQYFAEKKAAIALEDEAHQMQHELEGLHRRIMSQMETSNRGSGLRTNNNKPSQQNNLIMQATRIQHETDGLQRIAENVKMKLNAEIKLKQQVEEELKAIRSSVLHNKTQAKITPRGI